MTNTLSEKQPFYSDWAIRSVGCLAIVAVSISLLRISWGKWPDILIDYGRELYVPWALSQGKVLYKDFFYFLGPISPYWNMLCFKLFGIGAMTLVWANLALLAILMFIMYIVLRRASSRITAFAALLVFTLIFAFSQYWWIGNYNYVSPYSHEATHGMLFSWGTMACLVMYGQSSKIRWLAGAGGCSGIVFLTKPIFFAAVLATSISTIALWFYMDPNKRKKSLLAIGLFVLALLIPPLIAFGCLSIKLSPSQAGLGILGGWQYVGRVLISPFYKHITGMAYLEDSLLRMLRVAVVVGVVFLQAVFLSLRVRTFRLSVVIAAVQMIGLSCLAWYFWNDLPLSDAGRPLPLFMLLSAVLILSEMRHNEPEKHIPRVMLIVFAMVLLAKMQFFAKFWHYGFVFAMPATMVLVLLLLDWLANAIKNREGQSLIFRSTTVVFLTAVSIWHITLSYNSYEKKTVLVGQGDDLIVADTRGQFVNLAVNWLKEYTRQQDTLLVLPEGIILNYLSRRQNPTPIISLVPTDIIMYNEKILLNAVIRSKPDYIAIVHRETSEYGYRFFGKDYGKAIWTWIERNYRPVKLIGYLPLRDQRSGILILRKQETT